ncbi:MAG: hypothetical protein CL927_03770 [Deltaproteobacteria bacterium]|nr:hypothetical protein [Deltaproteobacteria bacterium]HCH63415.1 hypothetical protein [Deltaproteobacteria bacterium]
MQFVVSARGGASAEVVAPNWLAALGFGLDRLGTVGSIDRLACEVLMNGTVLVRDARTGEGYVVRPLGGPAPTDLEVSPDVEHGATSEEALLEYEDDSELVEATLVEEPTSEARPLAGDSPLGPSGTDDQDPHQRGNEEPEVGSEGWLEEEDETTDRSLMLQRPTTLLAGLSQITDAVSVGMACEAALLAIQEVVKSESGSVLLQEPGGALRFAAVTGPSAVRLRGSVLPRRAGIAGFVIERSTGLIVRSAQADPRFYGEVDRMTGYRTRSVLCVPLGSRVDPIGCIQLLNPPGDQRFEAPGLRLAQEVAEALTARLTREHLST